MNFPELRQRPLLCRLREEGNFGKSDSSIIVLRIFRWAGNILHYITVHEGKLGYLKKIQDRPKFNRSLSERPSSTNLAELANGGGGGGLKGVGDPELGGNIKKKKKKKKEENKRQREKENEEDEGKQRLR